MTILSDRFRGLRKIPHIPLAELPTAVEPLERLSQRAGAEIWIKRDDRTSPRYGGNKVRKLEYVLGEVRKGEADTIVTAGAAGSHHVVACGLFGGEQGLKVHAVMTPQRFTSHVEENLRASLALGVEVHPAPSAPRALATLARVTASLRLRGRRPFVVPPGGSDLAGIVGYVEAGIELARQLEAGVCPEPDAIFVALGSGGTAAGLAVGLAATGVTAKVVGVRVVPALFTRRARVMRMIDRTVAHLRQLDERFPEVASIARGLLEIDAGELGDGYGEPTAGAENASRLMRELGGPALDGTYTAKAFAGLLRHASGERRGQRMLFIHTLSSAPLGPLVGERPPPLPGGLQSLLRRPS